MKYRCLNLTCRRVWESQLSTGPDECPWCGSTHIIKEETFQRICNRTRKLINKTPLGALPSYDAILAIFADEEFDLLAHTPRFRRALLFNVLLEVNPDAPLSQVISLISKFIKR